MAIIIKLKGGLGNQMFQFALSSVLAKKNNSEVYIDRSFFDKSMVNAGATFRNFELEIFNLNLKDVSAEQKKIFNNLSLYNRIKKKLNANYPQIFSEKSFLFHPEILSFKAPIYLSGYFQSYKYFRGHKNLIRDIFKFPVQELDPENKVLLSKIKNKHSISIHIRRGDYVTNKNIQKFHGNCDVTYYKKAINFLLSQKPGNLFFFSDDIEWVKTEFNDIASTSIFVANNQRSDSWKDMLLMSCCNYNIIANSSFSWWAAWLNINKDKIVIAPKKWFANKEKQKETKDLIPPEWIRL